MTRFLAGAIVVALFALHVPASAQRGPGAAPSPGPGWLPRESYIDANMGFVITAAEKATVVARLTAVEALLRKVDAVAKPHLFEGMSRLGWAISGDPAAPRERLLGYGLNMVFWAPTLKINSEGTSPIQV